MPLNITVYLQPAFTLVPLQHLAGITASLLTEGIIELSSFSQINMKTRDTVAFPPGVSYVIDKSGESKFVVKDPTTLLSVFRSTNTFISDIYGRIGNFTKSFNDLEVVQRGLAPFGELSFFMLPSLPSDMRQKGFERFSINIVCKGKGTKTTEEGIAESINALVEKGRLGDSLQEFGLGTKVRNCKRTSGGYEVELLSLHS